MFEMSAGSLEDEILGEELRLKVKLKEKERDQ